MSDNSTPQKTTGATAVSDVPGDHISWHGSKAEGYDALRFTTSEGVFIERFEEDLFLKLLTRHGARRVLDIPAGTGRLCVPLARSLDAVVGADISPDMLAEARGKAETEGLTNISFEVANVADLPFDNGAFDAVCTARLFQHVPTDMAAPIINELTRVIRPGGVFVVQFRSGLYGGVIHRLRYGKRTDRGGLRNRCIFPDQVRQFFGERKILGRAGYKFPGSGRLARIFGFRFVSLLNLVFSKIPGVRWLGCYMLFVVERGPEPATSTP